MNLFEISCDTVHPFIRQTFNGEMDEDQLLGQIAECAATEYANFINDRAPESGAVAFTWPALQTALREAIELALYSHKAMTENTHVAH